MAIPRSTRALTRHFRAFLQFRAFSLLIIMATISNTLEEMPVRFSGAGFHRTLELDFHLNKDIIDCLHGWKWSIPAGLYVDVDELAQVRGFTFCTSEKPRVEWMQKDAHAYDVYIFPEGGTHSVSVPVHARYHAPSTNSTVATVDITDPIIISNCHLNCNISSRVRIPCDDERRTGQWCLVAIGNNTGKFSCEVPVGNLNHLLSVAIVTALVTLGGTLYTVFPNKTFA